MLRTVLGTVAGAAIAVGVIYGWEIAGHRLFPLPAGVDLSDPADTATLVQQMPLIAQAWVVAGYVIGVAVGGSVANLVVRARWPALVVALLVAGAFVATLTMLPHPLWMQIAGVALPLLGGIGVAANAGRAPAPDEPAAA